MAQHSDADAHVTPKSLFSSNVLLLGEETSDHPAGAGDRGTCCLAGIPAALPTSGPERSSIRCPLSVELTANCFVTGGDVAAKLNTPKRMPTKPKAKPA